MRTALPSACITVGRRSSSRLGNCDWREIRKDLPAPVKVKELRSEVGEMEELVADLALENRVPKKSIIADGGGDQE